MCSDSQTQEETGSSDTSPETEVTYLEEECQDLRKQLERKEEMLKDLEAENNKTLLTLEEQLQNNSQNEIGPTRSYQIKDGKHLKFEMNG